MSTYRIPASLLDRWERAPVHAVAFDLGVAAWERDVAHTAPFKKLIAAVLELGDGRDRRERWATRDDFARPIARLRLLVDECFGTYGELEWFNLNRTANAARLPLVGLFPRMAAAMSRVAVEDFGQVVAALVSPVPDAALMSVLHAGRGRVPGMAQALLARVAYAFRPDLYFLIPPAWGKTSGCLKYIGTDLRKYVNLCRTLREVCQDLGIPEAVRGIAVRHGLEAESIDPALQAGLDAALGPRLARFRVLGPADAHEVPVDIDDPAAMPMEFAAAGIRARRGEHGLRLELCRRHGNRCAIMGTGPRDLLEVAYISRFPRGDVHAPANALLLRSDVHTLWDLNLITVDPAGLRVRVAAPLRGTEYETLEGRAVTCPEGQAIDREALRERFDAFASQHALDPAPRLEADTPHADNDADADADADRDINGVVHRAAPPATARTHRNEAFPPQPEDEPAEPAPAPRTGWESADRGSAGVGNAAN